MAVSIPSILSDLNDEQRLAVEHTNGPVLILAGAGSGKTRALTYRAAYLMANQGVSQDRILLVTFTNKAAAEMQQRLLQLAGVKLPFAGTFHSFCARVLRIEGRHIGLSPDFVIYDENDRTTALKQAFLKAKIDPKEVSPRSVGYAISAAKNELLGPLDYEGFARGLFQERVATLYRHYQKILRDAWALDFDDLLFLTVQLMKESDHVRKKYQEKFLHVMVDEYQDTNKAQYALTKILAEQHKNLCVVGDASQSIYKFRGADYRNLMALKRDFSNLTTYELTRNYRSTQNILDAAYGVIGNNKNHPILKLWTEELSGEQVTIFEAKDEKDEARYVLRRIGNLQKNDPSLKLDDVCVLYRTNAQSRVFEEVFLRSGTPYDLVGGVEFFQRKEIKDVLAYFRLALNPNDIASLTRVEKIGKRRLRAWQSWLEKFDPTAYSPLELLSEMLTVTGYLSLYNEEVQEDLARIENIRELSSVAAEFTTMHDFLDNVSLVQNKTFPNGSANVAGEAVHLMTLHASKGLEFRVIFLVGMEEGLFPHSRALLDREELEEERRLCYVGITRAKEQLYLTHAQKRLYFGVTSNNMPSRFLSEIPASATIRTTDKPLSDDKTLDSLLNDEIDIDEFLELY